MSDKDLANIVCRALLAIVSAVRKKYDLPAIHPDIVIVIQEKSELRCECEGKYYHDGCKLVYSVANLPTP